MRPHVMLRSNGTSACGVRDRVLPHCMRADQLLAAAERWRRRRFHHRRRRHCTSDRMLRWGARGLHRPRRVSHHRRLQCNVERRNGSACAPRRRTMRRRYGVVVRSARRCLLARLAHLRRPRRSTRSVVARNGRRMRECRRTARNIRRRAVTLLGVRGRMHGGGRLYVFATTPLFGRRYALSRACVLRRDVQHDQCLQARCVRCHRSDVDIDSAMRCTTDEHTDRRSVLRRLISRSAIRGIHCAWIAQRSIRARAPTALALCSGCCKSVSYCRHVRC